MTPNLLPLLFCAWFPAGRFEHKHDVLNRTFRPAELAVQYSRLFFANEVSRNWALEPKAGYEVPPSLGKIPMNWYNVNMN